VADSAEPMGDDDAGTSAQHARESLLDQCLCSCINAAGCFVEDEEDLRIKR
jgi:hypothetical protein